MAKAITPTLALSLTLGLWHCGNAVITEPACTAACASAVEVSEGPPEKSKSSTAEFAIHCPDCTLECSLNGAAFEPCAQEVRYDELEDGPQTLVVRATAPDGHQTEHVYEWQSTTGGLQAGSTRREVL